MAPAATTDSEAWKPYNLPRNQDESARLELQHKIYVDNAGFLVHPRIASTLSSTAAIADVATGTGIWIRSVAADAPSDWSLHGFDISPAQFPSPEKRGKCHLHELNILEPIPSDFREKFDVVHVRLLVCGLIGEDWTRAARGLFDLLKPGGYVQWHEAQFYEYDILQNQAGASTVYAERLFREAVAAQQSVGKILRKDYEGLEETVTGGGFVDVRSDVFSSDRVAATRATGTWNAWYAMASLQKLSLAHGLLPQYDEKSLQEVVDRAYDEVKDDKIYYRWNMKIVTGRKPS